MFASYRPEFVVHIILILTDQTGTLNILLFIFIVIYILKKETATIIKPDKMLK